MPKTFKTHTFHSTLLLPEKVAKELLALEEEARADKLDIWLGAYQSAHYFRDRDIVYHLYNLEQPMIVDKILRKVYKDKEGNQNVKILGIEVHFWESVLPVVYA